AFLRARCASVATGLTAEKHVLELVHPGVGEEQRRVVAGNQRGTLDDAVALLFEVREKGGANLVRGHRESSERARDRLRRFSSERTRSASNPCPTRYRHSRLNSRSSLISAPAPSRRASAASASASSSREENASATARRAVSGAMPACSIQRRTRNR